MGGGAVASEIERFVTGAQATREPDRLLATVVFTDIARSTELARELGDLRWHELLDAHHERVRDLLNRFGGREIDTAGDGFFAAFEGPGRGVAFAVAARQSLQEIPIAIRAGVHTGECEVIDGKPGGLAVHIGARIAATAVPGEILVSSTVRDLVSGSPVRFVDRGVHQLKGIPEPWHLFSVSSQSTAAGPALDGPDRPCRSDGHRHGPSRSLGHPHGLVGREQAEQVLALVVTALPPAKREDPRPVGTSASRICCAAGEDGFEPPIT